MKIHEHQGKELFKKAGVPVPNGYVAFNVNDAINSYNKLDNKILAKQGTNPPDFIKALLKAEAYPHHVFEIELIETHISWIILTGKYSYKINFL